MRGRLGRIIGDSAHDFRNVMSLKVGITRIDALRRESQQEIFVQLQTGL